MICIPAIAVWGREVGLVVNLDLGLFFEHYFRGRMPQLWRFLLRLEKDKNFLMHYAVSTRGSVFHPVVFWVVDRYRDNDRR